MPWIHRDDWVELMAWLVASPSKRTRRLQRDRPAPVTNAEFTRTLGQVLHRPAIISRARPSACGCSSASWPTRC